ncbi:MAG: tetratricopeptide repeat protein [Phycisphaerae bacterium]
MEEHKSLVKFLAAELDATQTGQATEGCPDEIFWAQFSDGLIMSKERDELISHLSLCSICRKRVSAIIKEMDVNKLHLSPTSLIHEKPVIYKILPIALALAACIILVIGLSFYSGFLKTEESDYGINTKQFLLAQADLSELGYEIGHHGIRSEIKPPIDEAAYRTIMNKLSKDLNQPFPRANVLNLGARAALSARFVDDALIYAGKWAKITPQDPTAFNALGLCQFQKNQFDRALKSFEKALSLNSHQPSFYLNAAMAADEMGQTDKTIHHLRRFINLVPSHRQVDQAKHWLAKLEKDIPQH